MTVGIIYRVLAQRVRSAPQRPASHSADQDVVIQIIISHWKLPSPDQRVYILDGCPIMPCNSGDLCRSISNGNFSSVACCDAMQGEFKPGDTLLLNRSNGVGMTVRYLLPPRTIGIQISLALQSN
jgi:hypothetical protein